MAIGHVEGGGKMRQAKKKIQWQVVEEAEDGDLMEDEETFRGPDGTVVDITITNIDKGDWLTVIYDDHWWLTKCLQLDREHQDVKVECMHPSGPTVNFHPKHGRRDVCFCPLKDIVMTLTGTTSPLQSSRTRELYSITPDVMDFIEHKRALQHNSCCNGLH